MRFRGRSMSGEESDCVVRDVTITKSDIYIDYVEHGDICLVSAKSKDGFQFNGTYGCPSIPSSKIMGKVSLELFKGKGGKVVLVASWNDHATGFEGEWIFVLEREPK